MSADSPDTTRRDALARSIAARLLMCNEAELERLDRALMVLEQHRDHELDARIVEARRKRRAELDSALRELRDAMTQRPRRHLEVIDGGRED